MSKKTSRDRKKPKPVDDDDLFPCPLACGHPGLRKLSGVQGHLRFANAHRLTTEEIRAVIAMGVDPGPAPVRKVRTVKKESIPESLLGASLPEEDDSSVTVNDVIMLRGKLRQYSTRMGEAEGTAQFDLIPQKEFLRYAYEQLAKEIISVADFVLIQDAFEDVHRPIIDGILEHVDRDVHVDRDAQILSSQDLEIRKSRLLSRTRDLQKLIHTQPETERSRLDVELTILRDMSRKMFIDDVDDEDLKLIESRINDEIQPYIDAVIQTPPMNRGMDDFLDQTQNDLEQEFRIKRLRRQIREEDTMQSTPPDLLTALLPLLNNPLLNNPLSDNSPSTKIILETVVELKLKMLEMQTENQMIINILLKMRDGA